MKSTYFSVIDVHEVSEEIPQSREEVRQLFDELNSPSSASEIIHKENIKIPFSGFIKNEGQKSNTKLNYYYSTKESYIGFEQSKIRFTQQIKTDSQSIDSNDGNLLNSNNNSTNVHFLDFYLSFVGANMIKPQGIDQLSHSTNYFRGNSQHMGISSYDEIWYYNIYDSIDLRYFMTYQGLKYEFIVHPEGDPNQIALQISEHAKLQVKNNRIGISSKDSIRNDEIIVDSNLLVYSTSQVYDFNQDRLKNKIQASFKLKDEGRQVYGFQISRYNPEEILVIDPLLLGFSTFFGGGGDEIPNAITVDVFGDVYITGLTRNAAAAFPTTEGSYDEFANGEKYDVFITKLNSTGNGLVYSTLLGGSGDDAGYAIAVDGMGNVYVTGLTSNDTTDFPTTTGAFDETYNGGIFDIFVTKLNSTGNGLVYSTFLGGDGFEEALGIAVDGAGNAYITGDAASTNFPITEDAYDESHNGDFDVFISKINSDGNSLVYSTFLGGNGNDIGFRIVVDSIGEAYITGDTSSTNFPTIAGAYDETYNGGTFDIFVSKLNSMGNRLIYSTYIGGNLTERSRGIVVDDVGEVYIVGRTESTNFPTTPGAYNETFSEGNFDIFVLKLTVTGNRLVYSTFVGGSGQDWGYSIAMDDTGNVYITGGTSSADFPTTANAYDDTYNGGNFDVFVSKLDSTLTNLVYSTFLGGSGEDFASAIAIDGAGNVYITGNTASINFQTTAGSFDETYNEGFDGFVSKFEWNDYSTFLGGSNSEFASTIAIDIYGNVYVSGKTYSSNYPLIQSAYTLLNGGWDVFVSKLNSTGNGLIYSTFLGGSGDDVAWGIAVDSSGNVYITGETWNDSTAFPTTTSAFHKTHNGDKDVFVTKLNATGNGLVYSTFLGGSGEDTGFRITLDDDQNVYVTGHTASTNFPTTLGAYDDTYNGGAFDAFITKLNSNGSGLVYSTFLGGIEDDNGLDISVDAVGAAYITGSTASMDFPTTPGAYDESYNGGTFDVFVSKLDSNGTNLVHSTYLGGSGEDVGRAIVVDPVGAAYITGSTASMDFPTTPGAYDESYNGGTFDVFVSKLDSNGTNLVHSTYLGGSGEDVGRDIAVDEAGAAYITGGIASIDFPTTLGAYDITHNGGPLDAFISKFNSTGNGLVYSTYFGGSGDDFGYAIVIDDGGNVYVSGWTENDIENFPTTPGTYDNAHNGDNDVFVFSIRLGVDTIKPTLSNPSDLYYQPGQTGNTLTWEMKDINPNYYYITVDNETLVSDTVWVNGMIVTISVDGFLDGSHSVVINAFDTHKNMNTDTVYVIVDGAIPTIDQSQLELIIDSALKGVNPGHIFHFTINDSNGITEIFYNWDNIRNITIPITPNLQLSQSNEVSFSIEVPKNASRGSRITLNLFVVDSLGNEKILNLEVKILESGKLADVIKSFLNRWYEIFIGLGISAILVLFFVFYNLINRIRQTRRTKQTKNFLKKVSGYDDAKIFISHSSKDKMFAQKLYKALESKNIKAWISYENISGGEDYRERIINAIDIAEIMVLLLSKNAIISNKHIDRELHSADNDNDIILAYVIDGLEYQNIPKKWKYIFQDNQFEHINQLSDAEKIEKIVKKLEEKLQEFGE